MGFQPVNIDDHDAREIIYQDPSLWTHQVGKPNVQGGTYTEGFTNAVARFTFNGTKVMVFGVANPSSTKNQSSLPPSVSFSIDGGTRNHVSSPPAAEPQYSYCFYESGELSPGQHTLTILVNNGDDDWPFALDYIQFIPLPPPTSFAFPTSAKAAVTPTARSIAPVREAEKSKSIPTSAIVASVIAAIIGLGLLACGLWLVCPRLRRKRFYKHRAATRVDLLEEEPGVLAPSIPPSTNSAPSSYAGEGFLDSGPGSIDASHEPRRPFSPGFSSRSSSPAMVYGRPATPPAALHRTRTPPAIVQRPLTPPTIFAPVPVVLYPPGNNAPLISSPLGKAGEVEADRISMKSAGTTLFHADSGIRFASPAPGGKVVNGPIAAGTRASLALSEVPPEYTES